VKSHFLSWHMCFSFLFCIYLNVCFQFFFIWKESVVNYGDTYIINIKKTMKCIICSAIIYHERYAWRRMSTFFNLHTCDLVCINGIRNFRLHTMSLCHLSVTKLAKLVEILLSSDKNNFANFFTHVYCIKLTMIKLTLIKHNTTMFRVQNNRD